MRNKSFHYPLIIAFLLLLCTPFVAVVYAQSLTVTGTVTDSQGGVPGVNVKVKGSTTGTITDIDGKFTLNVPSSKSILVISYIGYTTQEVPVNNQKTLNIKLKEDTKVLDEVVVVGYGVQKKSHLTGSVSKMDVNSLTDIPVTQVDQLLQGKIAGVNIQNSTSEAGAAPQIRVRGMGSISADSSPLIVIDGYPVPEGLSTLDMADIASIEVLKDAASAAIYGSRAANGVILVTTKEGSASKAKYSVKASTGLKWAYKLHNAVVLADAIVQKVLAPLLTPVISVVLFFVAFALLRMLVSMLVTVLGLVNRLPVIGTVNRWLGWLTGCIASTMDIYLVLCVVWAIIVITGGNLTVLNDTVMSSSLYYKAFNLFNPFL